MKEPVRQKHAQHEQVIAFGWKARLLASITVAASRRVSRKLHNRPDNAPLRPSWADTLWRTSPDVVTTARSRHQVVTTPEDSPCEG